MQRIYKNLLILSVLVISIFGIVIYRQLPVGDYQHHLEWARELADKGYIFQPPNNLFQKLVVITRTLVPFRLFARISPDFMRVIDSRSYDIATWLLMMTALVITSWVVFYRYKDTWESDGGKFNPWLAVVLTLVVMLVGPIFFFTFPERTYLGYITGNVYHNPTFILLRPLAILVFILGIRQLYARPNWKNILIGAVLVALATQAKPSFTITFLPAIAIFGLINIKHIRTLNWWYLVGALAIPAGIILAEQFLMTYLGPQSDSIVFAPFAAILQYVPNIGSVILFILLSITFPLAATIVFWQKFRHNKVILMAWLNFGVALSFALLLSEVVQKHALNFWWGAMVALFILFVETIGQSVKLGMLDFRNREHLAVRLSLAALLGMHLVCGIIYYLDHILFPAPVI